MVCIHLIFICVEFYLFCQLYLISLKVQYDPVWNIQFHANRNRIDFVGERKENTCCLIKKTNKKKQLLLFDFFVLIDLALKALKVFFFF